MVAGGQNVSFIGGPIAVRYRYRHVMARLGRDAVLDASVFHNVEQKL